MKSVMLLELLSTLFLVAQCQTTVQLTWNEAGSTAVIKSINVGDTVTWVTTDYSLHTISGTNNEILNSTYISANTTFANIDRWSYKFDVEGSYDFQCLQHPNTMYGTIDVSRGRTTLGANARGVDSGYYQIAGQSDTALTISLSLTNPNTLAGIYVGVNNAPAHDPSADYYTSCSAQSTCRVSIPPCSNSVINTYYVDVATLSGSASNAQFSISTSSTGQFQNTVNGTACCEAMSYFTVTPTADYPVAAIAIQRTGGSFTNGQDTTDPSWGMFVRSDLQGCPDSLSTIAGQDVTFLSNKDAYVVTNLPKGNKYYIGVNVPSAGGATFRIDALSSVPSPKKSDAVRTILSSVLIVAFGLMMLL